MMNRAKGSNMAESEMKCDGCQRFVGNGIETMACGHNFCGVCSCKMEAKNSFCLLCEEAEECVILSVTKAPSVKQDVPASQRLPGTCSSPVGSEVMSVSDSTKDDSNSSCSSIVAISLDNGGELNKQALGKAECFQHLVEGGDTKDNLFAKIDDAVVTAHGFLQQLNEAKGTLKIIETRDKLVFERVFESICEEFNKLFCALTARRTALFAELKTITDAYNKDVITAVKSIEEQKNSLETTVTFVKGLKALPKVSMYCDLNQLIADLKVDIKNKDLIESLKKEPELRFNIHSEKIIKLIGNAGQISTSGAGNCPKTLNKSTLLPTNKDSYALESYPDVKPKHGNGTSNVTDAKYLMDLKTDLVQTLEEDCQMEENFQLGLDSNNNVHQASRLLPPTSKPLPYRPPSPDVIIEEIFDDEQDSLSEIPSNTQCHKRATYSKKTPFPEFSSCKSKKFKKGPKKTAFSSPFCQKKGTSELVHLVNLVNPCNFYVHRFVQKRYLLMLERMLTLVNHTRDTCSPHDILEQGEILVFRSARFNAWCRGRITELIPFENHCFWKPHDSIRYRVEDISHMMLYLIDYGFSEVLFTSGLPRANCKKGDVVIRQTKVKCLGPALIKLTSPDDNLRLMLPFAIHCSLDLIPATADGLWPKEANDQIHSMINNKFVLMLVRGEEDGKLIVDLKKAANSKINSDMPLSLREALVFLDLAKFPSNVPMSHALAATGQYRDPILPPKLTETIVIVCHTNDPSDFYIHLHGETEFIKMVNKIQDVYDSEEADAWQIQCPVKGQACIARYTADDEIWYRAEVVGLPCPEKVDINYVDFGNVDTVDVTKIRQLKPEFLLLPRKAICCRLAYIQPSDNAARWSLEACKLFEDLTCCKHLRCSSIGVLLENKLSVELFDTSPDNVMSINNILVQKTAAEFIPRTPGSVDPRLPLKEVWDPVANLSLDTVEKRMDAMSVFESKELDVLISHVVSPSKIFVQWLSSENTIKSVEAKLLEKYENSKPENTEWQVGMHVAAQFPADKKWRRGKIKNILPERCVQVFCYDSGIEELMDVANLRTLDENLKMYGAMSLECSLMDIQPAGGCKEWTATACDFLCYYLNGAIATLIIEENASKWPLPVKILSKNEAGELVDVSDFLVRKGLALRDRSLRKQESLVELNETVSMSFTMPEPKNVVTTEPMKLNVQNIVTAEEMDVTAVEENPIAAAEENHISVAEGKNMVVPEEKHITMAEEMNMVVPEEKHIAVADGMNMVMPEVKHISVVEESNIEVNREEPYLPPVIPNEPTFIAKVTHVAEDGTVFAVQESLENALGTLMLDIQSSFKCLGLMAPYDWKKGEGCLIRGSDGMSYRGRVLEMLGGDMIKVRYEDFGFTEKIPKCHLYPSLFSPEVPRFSIPFRLTDVLPVGDRWQPDAIELLKELLAERLVNVHLVEPPRFPGDAASAYLYCGGGSVSAILEQYNHCIPKDCEMKMGIHSFIDISPNKIWSIDFQGLMDNDWETPLLSPYSQLSLPPPGEIFPVKVTHIQTPNMVYVCLENRSRKSQLGESDDDDLENNCDPVASYLEHMNQDDGEELLTLTDFRNNMPCLAIYSDGLLHRAKLVSIKDYYPLRFLMEFVDYGSTAVLDISKLFQLPQCLIQYPAKAMKVRLAGFKPPKEDLEEERLPYRPEWSLKAVYDMIYLVQGRTLFATRVTGAPDHTVFLYDEKQQLVHKPLINSKMADLDTAYTAG
ncbi:RING finger protein 17 [Hyperolius riggenbachi]|uniref:RING finger protein 17 n=1 Tax=Hyperolius riggenbachi TaxID=752182 RepID=UPI0035A26BDF